MHGPKSPSWSKLRPLLAGGGERTRADAALAAEAHSMGAVALSRRSIGATLAALPRALALPRRKRCVTRQLGSPGEHARWGSGFDSPWRGGGGPPLLRAPTVAKHLVSAPPMSCHVSSPRLHARVSSRAAPALAPPLPHHTPLPLSTARHLLPLTLSRCRGLKTVDFWGRRKVRPRALPQPRPRSPFEQPYGPCS